MKQIRHDAEVLTIYEYEDAEALIRELSVRYAEDYTVVRRGRKRSKIKYYNYACSFDIETTTIAPGSWDYDPGPDGAPVGFPYLYQWCIYDHVIMVRHMDEALDVFRWLSDYF